MWAVGSWAVGSKAVPWAAWGVLMICATATAMAASWVIEERPGMAEEFVGVQNAARAELGEPPLQWSKQLEQYARWWAGENAERADCGLHHSGGPYGENVFWGSPGKDWSPQDAASQWANEKRWYIPFLNACLLYDGCGHYTQIVWRSTRSVGCAKVTCSDGNVFITCNYDPPGNYLGQRPY